MFQESQAKQPAVRAARLACPAVARVAFLERGRTVRVASDPASLRARLPVLDPLSGASVTGHAETAASCGDQVVRSCAPQRCLACWGRVVAMPVNADEGLQARMVTPAYRRPARPVLWWARDFPGGEDQVRQARHWIEDLLPQCDPLADIVLLASEACTNAILHTRSGKAGGRFSVDVEWAQEMVRVVIGDQGSSTAPAITAKAQDATWADENGRGLWLVDELADDWGTVAHRGNRWVWIEMQWQARGGPPLQVPGGCEAAGAGIRAAFPGTTIWWGHQTRAWQAAISGATGAGGLVKARTRGELCRKLVAVYPDSGGSRDGAW